MPKNDRARRNEMNEELLESIEREVLGWPGVSKQKGRGPFWVPPSISYRVGGQEIGHIHDNGVADLPFPREIHDELIATGRAKPHAAGFPEVVSYPIREPEDVPGAVELFRMSYDRARTKV
jgi:luciferase-like monooxygenase